ncbi:MAG: hypothetical protein J5651_01765 [Salinivirgaceae bacterium]|nr:hypothetical protein [Salinivirgaceae bacterium]MBO7433683.1 hypothetical protein [Salinivirgaceae bacterium]MBO7595107.1 hypothetical protein [Salinivirgaceae bacterium]
MNEKGVIQKFSKTLFWDVDSESIDLEINAPYVVQRVLERGQMSDWRLLCSYYGKQRIIDISKHLRSLEPRALAFVSAISSTPKEEFRCYTMRQSMHAPWIY